MPRCTNLLTLNIKTMKKALVIIACVAFVGAFTSCNKKCSCKIGNSDVSVEKELSELKEDYAKLGIEIKKCSDLNTAGVVVCK